MEVISWCKDGSQIRTAIKHARMEQQTYLFAAREHEIRLFRLREEHIERMKHDDLRRKTMLENQRRSCKDNGDMILAVEDFKKRQSKKPRTNSFYGTLCVNQQVNIPLQIRQGWANLNCMPGRPDSIRAATTDMFVSFKPGTTIPAHDMMISRGWLPKQSLTSNHRFFRRGRHGAKARARFSAVLPYTVSEEDINVRGSQQWTTEDPLGWISNEPDESVSPSNAKVLAKDGGTDEKGGRDSGKDTNNDAKPDGTLTRSVRARHTFASKLREAATAKKPGWTPMTHNAQMKKLREKK